MPFLSNPRVGATCLTLSALLLPGCAPHWSYSGKTGPAHWGKLQAEYSACAKGKNQSPVDMDRFVEADLDAIEFNYRSAASEIVHKGYTVQANMAPGSTLSFAGKTFELLQFHFHSPSENRIQGRAFPLETHLVHASADGQLAVVAAMLEPGDSHPIIDHLIERIPKTAGEKAALKDNALSAAPLLPDDTDYFHYTGSLTTPPCSEGVHWLVLKQPIRVSPEQIKTLTNTMPANNRPLQPLNGRLLLR